MATTLEQVMSELNPYYQSSKNLYQQQLDALPGQADAEVAGLDAKLSQANDNILSGARSRGLGFSGIPIGEQAQYAATDYAPAVAKVKQTYASNRLGILDALNGLDRDQRTQAQGIYESARNFEEQQRQFNEQMAAQRAAAAAASAGAGSYLGSGGGGGAAAGGAARPGAATIQRTAKGGFNFVDGAGKPINAAQYAQLTGVGIRSLLAQMASSGDGNAKVALQYVGNDGKFGSAPGTARGALSALGLTGNYVQPKLVTPAQISAVSSGLKATPLAPLRYVLPSGGVSW